ncbi:hypothetical protein JKP88DRAFT_257971 [Tribonema minus]|uniref:SAM domain-containing protein n=1 Tax=Tribonema minus TaxID=303371 RepID=A0A835YT56_9STRA|nr:hypothetical protein JKP88DRAFT_257971 [Tribonema minus]
MVELGGPLWPFNHNLEGWATPPPGQLPHLYGEPGDMERQQYDELSLLNNIMAPFSPYSIKRCQGFIRCDMDIDAEVVGWVIGRNGSTIKDLKNKTGCNMWVDQRALKLTITGPDVCAVEHAAKCVEAYVAAAPIKAGAVEAAVTRSLECPPHLLDMLGDRATIARIVKETRAQVVVNKKMARVIIRGNAHAVHMACGRIQTIIAAAAAEHARRAILHASDYGSSGGGGGGSGALSDAESEERPRSVGSGHSHSGGGGGGAGSHGGSPRSSGGVSWSLFSGAAAFSAAAAATAAGLAAGGGGGAEAHASGGSSHHHHSGSAAPAAAAMTTVTSGGGKQHERRHHHHSVDAAAAAAAGVAPSSTLSAAAEERERRSSSSASSGSAAAMCEAARVASLAELLCALKLTKYARPLEENEVDLDALQLMSEADFTDLGIPKGPRLKIMNAARALGGDVAERSD